VSATIVHGPAAGGLNHSPTDNPPPKGCDKVDCSIPEDAFEGARPKLGLVEHCRLSGLPDLNQTEPFVRSQVRGRRGWKEGRA
jgi:hypothetical protein